MPHTFHSGNLLFLDRLLGGIYVDNEEVLA